jgi:hypothetical protein
MTNFINMTPHTVNLLLAHGTELVIEPSGLIARCEDEFEDADPIEGLDMPLVTRTHGEVTLDRIEDKKTVESGIRLPNPVKGTVIIVSGMARDAIAKSAHPRRDIVAPDTGKTALRNDKGHILKVTRLVVAV